MIIDGHCHAGKGDGLTGPWDTAAPLKSYVHRARRAGIDRTVLVPCFHSNYGQANAQIQRIAARQPDRFYCFAQVHAVRDTGQVREMIAQAVEKWGFVGLKVHRLDAPATREICQAAADFVLPLLYDVAGQVWRANLLAQEYPQVNFILPHLGSFGDQWQAHEQTIDLLVRYPNVFADTSGVRRFDYLLQAVRRAGPEKLIFGSDGPWLHPGLELFKIHLLRLPDADQALITGGNLLRLLPIQERQVR